jgi:hypothetical protein
MLFTLTVGILMASIVYFAAFYYAFLFRKESPSWEARITLISWQNCVQIFKSPGTSLRVPRTGHFPPLGWVLSALWQIGPMARFVEDLILTLPIIAGIDWCDPSVVPMPLGDPRAVNLGSLRLAFHTDNGIASATSDTVAVINRSKPPALPGRLPEFDNSWNRELIQTH